jgi:alpha-L-rhamnosidase
MREMALVLDMKADVIKYSGLMASIKASFIRNFYNREDKTFGSQTADALALNFGLVPDGEESSVAGSMRKDIIEKHSGHHSTGHMGTRYIYGELSRFGFGDVAQIMLNQSGYPSFGELFLRGANTIWEYWGEKIIDETSNGTRSRSHPFQGGFDAWFYNGIGGINPDPENPGYKHIILRPQIFGDLKFARASYNSSYGMIKSEWELRDGNFNWMIEIPVNTTADIYVPASQPGRIFENGKKAGVSEGLKYLRQEAGCSVFSVGSGHYRISVGPEY